MMTWERIMIEEPLETRAFKPGEASDEDFAAFAAFSNRMRKESRPEDPPRTVEQFAKDMRSIPPFVDARFWTVWERGEIVASANAVTWQAEHNQHLAEANLSVLPRSRRQGLATGLLRHVVEAARAQNRRLLLGNTSSRVPAGERFMARLGARVGLALRISQLELADVDRELLQAWQESAGERAQAFELGLWDGPFPEEDYDAVIALMEVMNTAPRDTLDIEDMKWTTEQLRQSEASMQERGVARWVLYARYRPSGELAGYTEIFTIPGQADTLNQGDTAVFPKYRNLGLGRWLKAAMLEKVLREKPEVKRIRTGNAESNAAMLRINEALGFKLYEQVTVWQLEVERALAYLEEKAS
jgi:mycothiol synthase